MVIPARPVHLYNPDFCEGKQKVSWKNKRVSPCCVIIMGKGRKACK